MRIEDTDLTPAQRAELETAGELAADYFESIDPSATMLVPLTFEAKVEAFQRVRNAVTHQVEADREVASAVSAAREARMSWREIGEAIGVSGEAARLRYSKAS
ncbi:hypothetical protein AB1046_22505 [Promicromonospora sp. Populi]|uniref:hypothetical protein n=1 Tax=Promicromonospora sp. Populi TaxID=3239420 RepID=UPI0034E2C529